MKKGALPRCSCECVQNKKSCTQTTCRKWIDFPIEYNCCLISIYEHGPLTLRSIGERLGVSFARVKQIETRALKKMKKNRLLSD